MFSQLLLQLPILVLREKILYLPSKNWGLNKDHHHPLRSRYAIGVALSSRNAFKVEAHVVKKARPESCLSERA